MKTLERKVKKYLVDRGWQYLRPADLAKSIMIEGAELLELFQWENRELEEVKKDRAKLEEIKKELADVLIYAFDLAVLLELDVTKIMTKKLDYISKKYPAHLMRKNAKKGAGSGEDSVYWRIKAEHRRKSA